MGRVFRLVGESWRAARNYADRFGALLERHLRQSHGVSNPRSLWQILKGTTGNWLEDQASSISAALAFYCARLIVNLPKEMPRSQPRPVPASASETSPLVIA
jgi:hypothetical protein